MGKPFTVNINRYDPYKTYRFLVYFGTSTSPVAAVNPLHPKVYLARRGRRGGNSPGGLFVTVDCQSSARPAGIQQKEKQTAAKSSCRSKRRGRAFLRSGKRIRSIFMGTKKHTRVFGPRVLL